MNHQVWAHRPPPEPGATASPVWHAEPTTAADLSAQRGQLRTAMLDGARPAGCVDEDVERLLIAFEELGSNGLRHGRPPVRMTVTTTGSGWLIDVSAPWPGRPPASAVGRDPADGGMGLPLVAQLCAAHGWELRDGRKHVWGCIDVAGARGPATVPPRPRGQSPRRRRD